MNFREMQLAVLRTRLEKSYFYEDIIFENKFINKRVKESISNWMFNLEKFKKIKIKKFKDLFSEFSEIVFPIKIVDSYGYRYGLDIIIIDNEGKKYYMLKIDIWKYDEMETYSIGRRNSPLEPLIDREFCYKISKDNTITLMEIGAMKLKPDGTNDDILVNFCYNSQNNTTVATVSVSKTTKEMKIHYPTMNNDFDKKILEYLFHINEGNFYYYDVFPILKWMLLTISEEDVSLSITAEIEKEIYSEIYIVNGIVQIYTKTEIINEEEMRINKVIFAKRLEEFLTKRN